MSGPQEINVTVGFYANQRSSKQLLSVLLSEVGEDIKSFRAILLWSKFQIAISRYSRARLTRTATRNKR